MIMLFWCSQGSGVLILLYSLSKSSCLRSCSRILGGRKGLSHHLMIYLPFSETNRGTRSVSSWSVLLLIPHSYIQLSSSSSIICPNFSPWIDSITLTLFLFSSSWFPLVTVKRRQRQSPRVKQGDVIVTDEDRVEFQWKGRCAVESSSFHSLDISAHLVITLLPHNIAVVMVLRPNSRDEHHQDVLCKRILPSSFLCFSLSLIGRRHARPPYKTLTPHCFLSPPYDDEEADLLQLLGAY